ncbi:winged helix DNA-binding domain-containing protein [Actinoplanes sp. NPDC048988]|uniref:winged helix DNA-binding domain-containing protein n=1 Tax=Actinoplanes sp. NPDC048988 TaxID=3363901 RepID=UPI00371A0361
MDSTTALGLRMSALFPPALSSVAEVVEWFGAMQAQDVNSGLWSFGARLPGFTLADVEAAVERREAVRTWPMRGTVHFVPPADVHWMLDLMGSRALAGAAKRRETIGLSEADADRAVDILGAALAGGGRLTRAQCLQVLAESGVATTGQRGYHLLWYAAQRGVTVIGPHIGKEQTFVLLDEWVPSPRRPSREEALALIALRYFRSHGPATRKDFAGWTGLTMTDCKAGIAGAELDTVDVDGVEMVVAPGFSSAAVAQWWALPGFDEYMLGYKDRSLMATPEQLAAIIPGGNGMFQSTLVRDGRVVATWKRAITAKGVTITVTPLVSFTAKDHRAAEEALAVYASYLGMPLTVKNP